MQLPGPLVQAQKKIKIKIKKDQPQKKKKKKKILYLRKWKFLAPKSNLIKIFKIFYP